MKREALTDKLIVLGIDGFDPMHAKFLMDQGKMPSLKAFVEKGSAREDLVLLGNMPTVTPPMWTTLATGATAATHGITGFFNQHPTELDTVVYALDSRMSKAEPLWNIFAEAGKKTLVWHWPGSSWPPTSDSENLSVVDGTQPSAINMGTAAVDWEKLILADETIDRVQFAAHDATDKGVAGCVITDLDETVMAEKEGAMTSSDARKAIAGGSRETRFVCMSSEETEVNLLGGTNADIVNSPIKEPTKWENAPEGAKEFTLVISGGFAERPCLILKNDEGIYDKVAIYKSKKDDEPLFVLEKDKFLRDYCDTNIDKHGESKMTNRNARILELAEDGSRVRIWMSTAYDINGSMVWHPQALHDEINSNVGYVPPTATLTAAEPENVEKVLLPCWDNYTQWQADCLTYFMKNNRFDVIFSHLHNVDALGHKFWHYAKHRDVWNNDETFYQQAMDYVYKQTDEYLKRFLPYVDEGWTIIITSDHGLISEENEPPVLCEGTVSIPVMRDLGYTVMKKDENGRELRDIDWSKTRAVATRGGHVYINLKGRNPGGIVEEKDVYDLEAQIISDLYNYRDPHTNKRAVSLALRNRDAIHVGLGGPECGDIVLFMEEGFNIIHMDSMSTQRGYYHTSVSPIFVAAGPGIKENFTTDRVIRQVDVAPTVAVLGGVRMPAQCEGAPAYQILTEEF